MVKGILSFGGVEVLSRLSSWAVIALLPVFGVSLAELGSISLLFGAEAVLSVLFSRGLDRSVLRFYNATSGGSSLLRSYCHMIGKMFLVAIALLCVARFCLTDIMGVSLMYWASAIFAAYARAIGAVLGNAARVDGAGLDFALHRLVFNIPRILLLYWLVGAIPDSIHAYSLAVGVSSAIYLTMVSVRLCGLQCEREELIDSVSYGYAFFIHAVSASLFVFADRFIAAYFLSADELGVYVTAITYGANLMIFAFTGLSTYFEPLMISSKDMDGFQVTLYQYSKYAMSAIGFGFPLGVVAVDYFSSAFSSDYAKALPYALVLAWSRIVYIYYLHGNYFLSFKKRPWFLSRLTIVSLLVQLIVFFLLTQRFHLSGAILSSVLCVILNSLIVYYGSGLWRNLDRRTVFVSSVFFLLSIVSFLEWVLWSTPFIVLIAAPVMFYFQYPFLRKANK